jgi:hypothetical protein
LLNAGRGTAAGDICFMTSSSAATPAASPIWSAVLVEDLGAEWRSLDARIAALDAKFAAMAREDEAVSRLATIPGIGVINATALVAAVGDAPSFGRGRDHAAWLGLTPRRATTGASRDCSAYPNAATVTREQT